MIDLFFEKINFFKLFKVKEKISKSVPKLCFLYFVDKLIFFKGLFQILLFPKTIQYDAQIYKKNFFL